MFKSTNCPPRFHLYVIVQEETSIGIILAIRIRQIKLPMFPVLFLVAFHVWHVQMFE